MLVLSVGAFFYLYKPISNSGQSLSQLQQKSSTATPSADVQTGGNVVDQPKELIKKDLVVGTGEEATPGKNVTVHYTGTLISGQKFDSSLDRGQPFTFKLGSGQVIQGWEQGVAGMKVGGKRKLTVPATLAYGDRAVGSIPPNSILVFEIELLKVE